jgi:hypothetical protein
MSDHFFLHKLSRFRTACYLECAFAPCAHVHPLPWACAFMSARVGVLSIHRAQNEREAAAALPVSQLLHLLHHRTRSFQGTVSVDIHSGGGPCHVRGRYRGRRHICCGWQNCFQAGDSHRLGLFSGVLPMFHAFKILPALYPCFPTHARARSHSCPLTLMCEFGLPLRGFTDVCESHTRVLVLRRPLYSDQLCPGRWATSQHPNPSG